MNLESADQLQGQESASIASPITLQSQSIDTPDIHSQHSKVDLITQDCSLDKIENLTSSLEISIPEQSTATELSCKHLIRCLYNLLVCEKLPATDESLNLSKITNKIFSSSEIAETELFDKKIEEFTEILEALSESRGCDKIKNHVCPKHCDKIEKMTQIVQLKIEKILVDKSRLVLLIKQDQLEGIAERYENLKKCDAIMKILFHKCHEELGKCQTKFGEDKEGDTSENETSCLRASQSCSTQGEIFKVLRNYQSENQKHLFKDLCDTFTDTIAPKTQEMFSSTNSSDDLTWNSLNSSIKSTVLNSYIDFQGYYIPLQELLQSNSEQLQHLSQQQILDIIQNGFTRVSKLEQLDILFYLKRTFIWRHMDAYVHENPFIGSYLYFAERSQQRQFIADHTKSYYNVKEELSETKILILADELGSGKTTTLKYFARRLKEDDNKLWVSYIDAGLGSKIFDEIAEIHDWSVDGLAGFLVEILGLTGIEVPIFNQKFKDNQVIFLWDHIDDKFQPTLIDFAYNIMQLTLNQQVFATRSRYSEKLAQKFDRTTYKFIPYTTEKIEKFQRRSEEFFNFYVGYWKFFKFCDSIGLGEGHYDYNREIFINNNMLTFKLFLLAVYDLKYDLDNRVDLFLVFEKVYKKQLLASPRGLTDDEETVLQKFLQAHALKAVFGYELTKSLKLVRTYTNAAPPISYLKGIFVVNYDDNSVDFQHKIIQEYFIMKFFLDNFIYVNLKDVKVTEAKQLVTIFAMILSQEKYKCLLKLIKDAFYIEHRNPASIKESQDNIFRIVKKAQFWPKVTKSYSPKKLSSIVHDNKFRTIFEETEFWEKLLNEIQLEKEKTEEKEKVRRVVQHPDAAESRSHDKELKGKPTIKGVTKIKKLNRNAEISHQLSEFLDDLETDESD